MRAAQENDCWVIVMSGIQTLIGRIHDTETRRTTQKDWQPSVLDDVLNVSAQMRPTPDGRVGFSIGLLPYGPCEGVIPKVHLVNVASWVLVSDLSDQEQGAFKEFLEQVRASFAIKMANEAGIILPGQVRGMRPIPRDR